MNEQTVHELRRKEEVMAIEPRIGGREEKSRVRSGEGAEDEPMKA